MDNRNPPSTAVTSSGRGRNPLLLALFLAQGCAVDSPAGFEKHKARTIPLIAGETQNGTRGFHFRPPLVPDVPFTGVFDPGLSPVVEIHELSPEGTSVSLLATYTTTSGLGSETIRVVPDDEHYIVNWHTRDFILHSGATYRVLVILDGKRLGSTDVVVKSRRESHKMPPSAAYLLTLGRTLPVKFRLETCIALPGTLDAICNGVDDDCDSTVDEDYVSRTTECGVGACAAVGSTSCVGGIEVDDCAPGAPARDDATCDGIDEDCDGAEDEHYIPVATSCGVGACAAAGVASCVDGVITNSCRPGIPARSDVTCDAVDNDCDGSDDEDYVPLATSCGVGACASQGLTSCEYGTVRDSCIPRAAAPEDATCNGVDDDCDGTSDEDFEPFATTCGTGTCADTGVASCVAGTIVDSCLPGVPTPGGGGSCECECAEWQDASCGSGGCDVSQMLQTRTCSPSACLSENQCVNRASCGGTGDDWGDPHLVTFDRLAYDFQGVGEYVLVRSVDDNLQIQVRTEPWRNRRSVSVTTAAAMDTAADRVAVYVAREPFLYVNGVPTSVGSAPVSLPNGGQISQNHGRFVVDWPDGTRAQVEHKGSYLNLKVDAPARRRGRLVGLLGNFDGDRGNEFMTRDGVILSARPSFDQLYKHFGDSWRIRQEESLFDYVDGDTTDTYTNRHFPASHVSTVVLSESERDQAEHVCEGAGVTDPVLFEACVLDVGLTGDASFADAVAGIGAPGGSMPIDGALGHEMENPARSCFDIQQFGVPVGDGRYWIRLTGGVVEVHCDFSSAGGGWTRVGTLDTSATYCGNAALPDIRVSPDAPMAKMPDGDVRSLMAETAGSPMHVMLFSPTDGRWAWHELAELEDFDTASRHGSSSFYCANWHCDDGTLDASTCGDEGDGCPITAHGSPYSRKKIYVDSSFSAHARGMHTNGSMCGLPDYRRAPVWIYVR